MSSLFGGGGGGEGVGSMGGSGTSGGDVGRSGGEQYQAVSQPALSPSYSQGYGTGFDSSKMLKSLSGLTALGSGSTPATMPIPSGVSSTGAGGKMTPAEQSGDKPIPSSFGGKNRGDIARNYREAALGLKRMGGVE